MKLSRCDLVSILDSPWRLRIFFLRYLPMAFLAGIRMESRKDSQATVSLPYRYLTKNPFQSIYFACQVMAAEFSTAVMLLSAIERTGSDIKLIVVNVEAEFQQKAKHDIFFTCTANDDLDQHLQQIHQSKESKTVILECYGKNYTGEVISTFHITWSLRPH